jgi:hypothetical protein
MPSECMSLGDKGELALRLATAPYDHLACPHCRVFLSGSGRVSGVGGCPTVGAGMRFYQDGGTIWAA